MTNVGPRAVNVKPVSMCMCTVTLTIFKSLFVSCVLLQNEHHLITAQGLNTDDD